MVKKLKFLCLAIVAFSLLAVPAAAHKGKNGAGKLHGQTRAEQVQAENKKGDKDPNPSKGSKSKKTRTREGWEKKAKHRGSSK